MIIKLNYRLLATILIAIFLFSVIFTVIYTATKAMSEDGIALPVIMYHHISEDRKALNDYVVTPEEFESDLKYLRQNGYTAILPKDLIAYTESDTPLPDKPIIISFDDGFESVYHYAYPLAVKYGFSFVFAILGKEAEHFSSVNDHNVLYSYVTWEEIKELAASGICEIANHTYDLHATNPRKGINIKKGEDTSVYTRLISEDILGLQQLFIEKSGTQPTTFVFPFGFICKESGKIIKELGFRVSFSCTEGINRITKNPECLYNLKRYNRPHGISSENFFAKMEI